jgi:hypothetical protein
MLVFLLICQLPQAVKPGIAAFYAPRVHLLATQVLQVISLA